MKLYEYEGKDLFGKYGIATPPRAIFDVAKNITADSLASAGPYAIKAQTFSGDRKTAGGILFAGTVTAARAAAQKLLQKNIGGEMVEKIIIEQKLSIAAEYYISISYDTETRGPVLALSPRGGTGVARATIVPINPLDGLPPYAARGALKKAGFPSADILGVAAAVHNLWQLFDKEYALLAEINPLVKTAEGTFIAADAKIILDDEKINPSERRFIDMDGDIAILASGGGASLLNIDALLLAGGKPANYTEYSGNPPAQVVTDLTRRVLAPSGLRGCWVIGGTANFTDIYETMVGFVEGLRAITPKPTYPILVRRDGPRQKEALAMLRKVAAEEGYDFHIYGSEISMAESGKIIADLVRHRGKQRKRAIGGRNKK